VILYLDTSALVKIYVEELHAQLVREWVEEATIVATSVVAYPEAAAAFARKEREGGIGPGELKRVLAALDRDWTEYAVLDIREREAGALAVRRGLRGFDAVHLDAALQLKTSAADSTVAFCAFDDRLSSAAAAEGFTVLGPPAG
jgi:predicted nucleic acid-binding protein